MRNRILIWLLLASCVGVVAIVACGAFYFFQKGRGLREGLAPLREALAVHEVDLEVVVLPYYRREFLPTRGHLYDWKRQFARACIVAGFSDATTTDLYASFDSIARNPAYFRDKFHVSKPGREILANAYREAVGHEGMSKKLFIGECYATDLAFGLGETGTKPAPRQLAVFDDFRKVIDRMLTHPKLHLDGVDKVVWTIADRHLLTGQINDYSIPESQTLDRQEHIIEGSLLTDFRSIPNLGGEQLSKLNYPNGLVEFELNSSTGTIICVAYGMLDRIPQQILTLQPGVRLSGSGKDFLTHAALDPSVGSMAILHEIDDFEARRLWLEEWSTD